MIKLLHYLWNHFKKQMRSEVGTGVATAIGGSAILGAVMSGNQDTPEGGGGGVVTMPQYGFTEPRQQLTSDFYTQQIQNLMSGEAPPYLQKYLPKIKKGMTSSLQESYLGRPGERRGAIQLAQEMGSGAGLGPKGSVARGEKQLRDYMTKSQQIDQYMAGLEMGSVQDAAKTFPYYSQMMPQGPNAQVVPGQPTPAAPDYLGQGMGAIASKLPYLMNQGGGDTYSMTPGTADLYGGGGGYGNLSSQFNQQFNAGIPVVGF